MAEDKNRALDFQEKFELYFVSLTFTLLALSIQSAAANQPIFAAFVEVSGWLLLLASGLVQLFRLQLIPVLLNYNRAKRLNISIKEGHREQVDRSILRRYKFGWWLFVAGLAAVMIARVISHMENAF